MKDKDTIADPAGSTTETTVTILPEHDLWHACIAQAIRGAQRGEKDDYFWCFSEHYGLGSYKWICDILDIDHMLVREQIIANNTELPEALRERQEVRYPEQLLKS